MVENKRGVRVRHHLVTKFDDVNIVPTFTTYIFILVMLFLVLSSNERGTYENGQLSTCRSCVCEADFAGRVHPGKRIVPGPLLEAGAINMAGLQ